MLVPATAEGARPVIDWNSLDPETQLRLRKEYGRDPACQTGTCSLDAKIAQFSAWLAGRGIAFDKTSLARAR